MCLRKLCLAAVQAGWRARGGQLVREEAGFAAQVTDGESWIRLRQWGADVKELGWPALGDSQS